ncbi:MAG TPA: hypothetical protein VIH59_21895 [Candidatus Tectomicrobia bacterium]
MMPTAPTSGALQSLTMDDFLYFFLQLRKARVRDVVQDVRTRYPTDTPEQLARRLTAAHAPLSFLGGSLLHLPMLVPGVGQVLQVLGVVMGDAALTRMHLH